MLKLTKLTLARGAKQILEQADLTIFPKEKVGLVGHNGAGKSSLIQAILGKLLPDAGDISLPDSWSIATIEQEIRNQDETVLEFALAGDQQFIALRHQIQQATAENNGANLASLYEEFEHMGGYQAEAKMASILSGLGFAQSDLSRKIREFSGGWQMRLNLARVLGSRSDLLLLDEPTNHLDIDAVLWFEQWIQQNPATLILVSHDRDFLDAVCSGTVHLNGRQLTKYAGGYSAFEKSFAERAAQIEQANQKVATERQHLQKFIDRFKAKATKAKQAQSRCKRLEKLQLIEQLTVDQPASLAFSQPESSPDPLVVLHDANCGYGHATSILNSVCLEIRPGDRIGLLGANGNGKTTLVKSLVGSLPLLSGQRTAGKGLVVGYFAQNEIDALDWAQTPMDHVTQLAPQESEQNLRKFLDSPLLQAFSPVKYAYRQQPHASQPQSN